MLKKIVSVYKQRVHCMTIPQKFVNIMQIQKGDLLEIEYDLDREAMIITKVKDSNSEF